MLNTKTNPRNDHRVVAECARFDVELTQKENGASICTEHREFMYYSGFDWI